MNRNKIIITIAIVFIIAAGGFMIYDFYYNPDNSGNNIFDYNIDEFTDVAPDEICYNESASIDVSEMNPKSIATDKNDNIYVAGSNSVKVLNSNGKLIKEFVTDMPGRCINVQDSIIYIGFGNHISVWTINGENVDNWDSISSNSIITSIASDSNSVFVADAVTKLVYRYTRDGEILNTIGKKDIDKGIQGFVIPSPYFDVAIGRNGELWAVNSGRHQLESYTADGKLISSWKKSSMNLDGFSGCCNPSHIAILDNGSFVTSEKGIERVKIHEQTGKYDCVVASPDEFIPGTVGLDLATNSKGQILVLDKEKESIRIFEKK